MTLYGRRHDPWATGGAFMLLGVCLMVWVAGCAEPPAESAPAPSADVARRETWHDAELLAAREEGRDVLVGAGESMAPVYGDGTVLVVRPIAFDQLHEGMTVVYLNSQGRRIAHRLLRREEQGWRARGLNNATPDDELVTPQNLIGVVYASLMHEPAGDKPSPAK